MQTCVIDPGAFRAVEALVNDLANGNGSLEVTFTAKTIFYYVLLNEQKNCICVGS
jgi:hypothetical protein